MGFVEYLFETKQGKTIMGLLYGMGAAVVIVGAMFKIMHWPGAGPMLVIGLSTEAVIFAVSAFEPAHMDLDWTLVYPELAGMDESHGAISKPVTEQLNDMLAEANIGPELIASLGVGLRKLGDNASKLSEISDASVATNDYTNSLKTASNKVSELADSYTQASHALTGLSGAADSGTATGVELQKMASTLESLNRSYEVQLSTSQQQSKTMNELFETQLAGSQQQTQIMSKMYEGMQQGVNVLVTNLSDSVEDTKRYKENISELAINLAKLNNVYGNMLTAMTVKA